MTHETVQFRYVGKPVLRREGVDKLTGRARYVDDIPADGALHARTLRTSIPSGRIAAIHFPAEIPWDEFIVADADDLAYNRVALIEDDQPALCDGTVRHKEEPILVVAHPNAALAHEAVRAIRVDYEPAPAALGMGEGPLLKKNAIVFGDAARVMAECDVVLEGTYETGAQEHAYIEPNGFVAQWQDGRVLLNGSHQCPYYVHKAIKAAFGLDDAQVNVVQETTGGGFGGKEDFPSLLAIHAALASRKAGGRPVRLMYDRQEDLASSTKRHPSLSRVRVGCTKDGILQALDFEFNIDGGAYVTLSPVVLSRGILHASGPYRWKAAHIRGKCHFTNSPPYGAFRGFGAPQSQFAIELHLDRLAAKLDIDPAELRRRNFLRKGDVLPTTQVLDEEPQLARIMDRALELGGYARKRAAYKRGGGRGISVAASLHGTGFTGSGEVYLKSVVAVEGLADGSVDILVSSTEIGQGTETIFPQIAAEAIGVPIEKVRFRRPETGVVPNSGPTVASRTCSVVGGLVEKAARRLHAKLEGRTVAAAAAAAGGRLRAEAQYEAPPGLVWSDETYTGCAYGAYSWCVNVADVSVDPVDGAPRVETLVGVFDVGRLINPTLVLGQVEGGMAQAAGWATVENVVLRDGVMANARMTNYIIPTSDDVPQIVADFVENPYANGAFGSKGVGELPMDSPGAAIVAAASFAAGRDVSKMPVMPEDLLA